MRVAVLGAGVMGRNHMRVLARLGHEVAAVVDPNPPGPVEAPLYADVESMLAADIEAAVVATPTVLHEALGLRLIEAGIPVLMEKPLAADVQAARRLVAAAQDARVTLAVGHVERHNPVVAYARDALADGRHGRPVTLSTRRVSRLPGRIRDVGCILDLGIHDLDVLNHLAAALPTEVYAVGGTWNPDITQEDHATILLTYPGRLHGVVEVNWLTPRKVRTLSMTCDAAYVECDYMDQRVRVSTTAWRGDDLSSMVPETVEDDVPITKEEPLALEWRDFEQAIRTRRPALADGPAGVAALQVADAALRSLRKGRKERVV
jgi:UDP-N-acetylglucosamine 3-dehydrogenase